MTIQLPGEACLRVQEVVFLVDVETLVVIAVLVVIELIVDTIRLIAHMPILQISEHIPLLGDMIGGLHEHVAVEFVGIRVVVFVVAISKILLTHSGISGVCDVAKVVTVEVLDRQSPDDIPRIILVIGVPHQSVGILRETLLAYKVRTLDVVTFGIRSHQSEL